MGSKNSFQLSIFGWLLTTQNLQGVLEPRKQTLSSQQRFINYQFKWTAFLFPFMENGKKQIDSRCFLWFKHEKKIISFSKARDYKL